MKQIKDIFKKSSAGVVTIGMVYLAFGLSWILFSDAIVQFFFQNSGTGTITAIQTYKGLAYVLITTVMLLLLIANFAARLQLAVEQQQEADTTIKKLVEEVGVGIARLNVAGRFLYANPDCCRFFGMTEEELLRKTYFELTYPDDLAQEEKYWKKLLNRDIEDFKLQKRFINNLNQITWAQEKVSIVEDQRRDPKYLVLVIHNINDLKKAENKLEENIRYYQSVLENSFDGVSIVDVEGKVKYQTPSVERITGYKAENRLGQNAFSLIASEDLPKIQTIYSQLTSNQITEARTIVKSIRADKELRYLDLYVKNMLADPLIKGLVVNYRDVTDKFKIENQLIESEDQYKLLFLNNPVPVFIYDTQTLKYLEVNHAAVKNYGYSKEEFLTMTLKDIRPKEDIQKVLEDIARIEKGQELDNAPKIWRHIIKDGTMKHVEISAVSINYKGVKARMSIANDVTHIIENQEAMRQSEERYRHLVEHLPAGAVLVQGENLYFNKAVSDITGYSLEEINTLGDWFQTMYRQDANLIRQFYNEDKATNFSAPRTVAIFTKNGTKRWVTFYAYKFETGEVWLLQDITERKKMDELIMSSILDAEDRERKRIAEELHDGLGHLLATASLLLEAFKENMDTLPAAQKEQIVQCQQFLQKAIQENRNITKNLVPLKLGEDNLASSLEALSVQFKAVSGIKVHFNNNIGQVALSNTTSSNLYRIAQEALSNTLKHAQATDAYMILDSNGRELLFTIADNGRGFAQNDKQNALGNGLGNIANRVTAMGGSLQIDSETQGTSISITIPLMG